MCKPMDFHGFRLARKAATGFWYRHSQIPIRRPISRILGFARESSLRGSTVSDVYQPRAGVAAIEHEVADIGVGEIRNGLRIGGRGHQGEQQIALPGWRSGQFEAPLPLAPLAAREIYVPK